MEFNGVKLRDYVESDFPMTVEFFEHNNEIGKFNTIEDYKNNKRSFRVIEAHWKKREQT